MSVVTAELEATVITIEEHVAATELETAATAGATTLEVVDLEELDFDGGTLTIGEEVISYLIDEDSEELTLASPLASSYPVEEPVATYPPSIERIAYVRAADDDEELEARVPHALFDRLDLGTRDETDESAELVVVGLEDDEWVITDLLYQEPVIDGTFIDPETLPEPPPAEITDGLAPSSSPTPTVTGGPGYLFAEWADIANADFTLFEVHASESTGFTPDASTLAEEVTGLSAVLATLGDGTPLEVGTTYFVKVIAKDADGAAAASAEDSGSPIAISIAHIEPIDFTDITGQATNAQIAALAASKITGTLTSSQIADLEATKITGTLTDAQIASISAAKMTGQIVEAQIADLAISAGKVAANAITTTKIADDAINAAKIALDAVGASEIASGAVGSGEIGTGAVIAGKIGADAVSAAEIAASAVAASEIATGAVGSDELAVGSVIAGKIAAGSVVAADIAANTITAGQIATGAVAADEIAAGAIVAGKIGADAITATEIQANAITASELAANSITAADMLANTITAAQITSGTITTAEIAAGTIVAGNIAANTLTATEINAGAITSSELAANAVIAGKILAGTIVAADIAADTITASQIAANAITATELNAGAVTAGKIAAGSIVAADIAANVITAGQIAAGAIEAAELAAGAVVAGKIAAGTIVAGDVAANTLTAGQIATNAITADEIAANAITAADILAGTITATEIATGTITAGKIATGTITANELAAGSVTASEIAAAAIDGMLITGATIRTSSSNPKLQMDSSGLGLYNASGTVVVGLDSGGLEFLTSGTSSPTTDRAINFLDDSGFYPAASLWVKRVAAYDYQLRAVGVPVFGGETQRIILDSQGRSEFVLNAPGASPATRAITRGSYTLTVGSSTASKTETVTHSLGSTPIAVSLTPDSSAGAGTRKTIAVVGNIGSSTFDITISNGDNTNISSGNYIVKWIAMS